MDEKNLKINLKINEFISKISIVLKQTIIVIYGDNCKLQTQNEFTYEFAQAPWIKKLNRRSLGGFT